MPYVYLNENDRIIAVHEDNQAVPLESYEPNGAVRVVHVPSTSLTNKIGPWGNIEPALIDGWEDTVIVDG